MEFLKGSQLFAFARKKATELGVRQERGISLTELIRRIQEAEGYQACFKTRDLCDQSTCCWRASCLAETKV